MSLFALLSQAAQRLDPPPQLRWGGYHYDPFSGWWLPLPPDAQAWPLLRADAPLWRVPPGLATTTVELALQHLGPLPGHLLGVHEQQQLALQQLTRLVQLLVQEGDLELEADLRLNPLAAQGPQQLAGAQALVALRLPQSLALCC